MARQCVLNGIQNRIFPLRTRSEITKWNFAEDYGLMFTIKVYIQQIAVWKLCGDTAQNVWTREGVVDAVSSTDSQQVLLSGADGVLQIWDFADSPKLVKSVQLGGPSRPFNSETYLFTIQADTLTL
jgi:hypothetical protein